MKPFKYFDGLNRRPMQSSEAWLWLLNNPNRNNALTRAKITKHFGRVQGQKVTNDSVMHLISVMDYFYFALDKSLPITMDVSKADKWAEYLGATSFSLTRLQTGKLLSVGYYNVQDCSKNEYKRIGYYESKTNSFTSDNEGVKRSKKLFPSRNDGIIISDMMSLIGK